jgi:phosphohistidine phosphatase SixA
VGHNPGLQLLINFLSNSDTEKFPTCALAAIRLKIDHWENATAACGELIFLETPKK